MVEVGVGVVEVGVEVVEVGVENFDAGSCEIFSRFFDDVTTKN